MDQTYQYFRPRSRQRHLAWNRQHIRNVDGRPYSHEAYPHLGAPGGPCDAADDPRVRRIWLQMGSRLGKTFFGQCCKLKKADTNPGPMLFATAVEKMAKEVIERSYRMCENSPQVVKQLRPEHRRRQSVMDFAACQCWVAWSRSVSTLADKEVEFGHANEIDKWEHQSTSKEADPLKLFLDRFKNRPHHKCVLESTPTVKGKSRIESGRLSSTNCQFCVPCPHCERYQVLDFDRIKWDKLENGKSDRDLARRTARYECEHCEQPILDHHRPTMMRLGVWCPEGCTVKDREAREAAKRCAVLVDAKGGDGESLDDYQWAGWKHADWIEGTPLRDGPDAGYQLSSLYALSLSWGDIAAEFVGSKGKPQDLRNFINQWLAKTWEVTHKQTTWEELGGRIIVKTKRLLVPNGYSFLTAGVDRQVDHFKFVVDAWGEGRKSHTVDYGECDDLEEIYQKVVMRMFAHEDRGESLTSQLTLIDSGYHPKDIYTFCKRCCQEKRMVWPCKGSTTALNVPYKQSTLGEDSLGKDSVILHVDTLTSQDWISTTLMLDPKSHEGAMTLFHGSLFDHQDFLEQLLNDAAVVKLGTNNVDREVWQRIDENVPNDYRDCKRYSYAGMLRVTRGAVIRPRKRKIVEREDEDTEAAVVAPPRKSNIITRPGGWMPERRKH